MARDRTLLRWLVTMAVGMGLALTPAFAQQPKPGSKPTAAPKTEAKGEKKAEGMEEKKPASEAKKPKEAGTASVFACPKCSAKGANFTTKKAGTCSVCKAEMVTEHIGFQCPKCKGYSYTTDECKKCKEKMTPALASWDCEACKWHSAAKRKKCPKCSKPTKETVVANNTQFECSKCQIRSAKSGKCPHCGAAMTKAAPAAAAPKKAEAAAPEPKKSEAATTPPKK